MNAPDRLLPYHVDHRVADDDPLQQQLDRLYGYADDVETRVLHRCRLNLLQLLLEELVARGTLARFGRALDIGCNAGGLSAMLSDLGFHSVEGLDIEPAFIARAQAAFGREDEGRVVRFRVEDAAELDPAGRYDFVLCTEVIEHTSRPERVVANLKGALAPGGLAVVTLPNACSLPFAKAALKVRLTRPPRDPVFEDHLRYPFWRALGLLSGGGMQLLRTAGTNLWWDATTLRLCYRRPGFAALNRAQFALARRWPLKYAAQFFFMVWRKREA
jgi:2-polyprenyl-6-hydroxyphenyl methylase/3-demethylubiquinone-9 3-methyltransferase